MNLVDLLDELKNGKKVLIEKRTNLLLELETWLTEFHGFAVDPEWGPSYRFRLGKVIAWDWNDRDIYSGLRGPWDFKI